MDTKATDIIAKYENGEMDTVQFLKAIGQVELYYSTPFSDCKDGSKRLFLLPGPDKTGYNPVFISEKDLIEFYEKSGRNGYMIITGNLLSIIQTTIKINAGETPVKMGVLLDPPKAKITMDVPMLEQIAKLIIN